MQKLALPPEVKVVETGTGGIHLVQEISAGFDALIVIDAVDRGRPPGTVMVIEPDVEDVHEMTDVAKYDFLADMHYTKPDRAFMLARALQVLPPIFLLVGGQPQDPDRYGVGLSHPVEMAVEAAVIEVQRLIQELLDKDRAFAEKATASAEKGEMV